MQSYNHFTLTERECLAELYKQGKKISEIAKLLEKNKSSISREIKRNKNKDKTYHPWRATSLYLSRRKRSVRHARLDEPELNRFVIDKLNEFWSPEAIVVRWKRKHPESKLSFSTIYLAVKRLKLPKITPKTHLRRRGKRKNVRSSEKIKPIHTIHERPTDIENRSRLGDLEGDTVSGAVGKGCVVTLVDRKSRMLYAGLCKSRDSNLVKQSIVDALNGKHISSLTLDNGTEFAKFQEIETDCQTTIYFADPHSPWQRGTNENTNDLLRFFFPKGANFHDVTDEQLQQAVALINNRPRKCLDWLSPVEFIFAKCCT